MLFFKQKTAYEMRISDWSSDVCSSDLGDRLDPLSYAHAPMALPVGDWQVDGVIEPAARNALQLGWGLGSYRYARFRSAGRAPEIGRASWRESVCQYV